MEIIKNNQFKDAELQTAKTQMYIQVYAAIIGQLSISKHISYNEMNNEAHVIALKAVTQLEVNWEQIKGY